MYFYTVNDMVKELQYLKQDGEKGQKILSLYDDTIGLTRTNYKTRCQMTVETLADTLGVTHKGLCVKTNERAKVYFFNCLVEIAEDGHNFAVITDGSRTNGVVVQSYANHYNAEVMHLNHDQLQDFIDKCMRDSDSDGLSPADIQFCFKLHVPAPTALKDVRCDAREISPHYVLLSGADMGRSLHDNFALGEYVTAELIASYYGLDTVDP